MTRTLLLVRHAVTTWHLEHRLQGRAEVPLAEEGRAQARALRVTFDGFVPDSVTTSDLGRTIETAQLMGFGDADRDPDWAEGDFGDWTGELISDVGDDYHAWRTGHFDPPGGEPLEAMARRVVAAADRVPGGRHLVVTHGGVIRMLLEHHLRIDLTRIAAVECAHVAILELGDPARLLAYNVPPGSPLPSVR